MRTKTLTLSMAAIMSLQSIGYANTSRINDIGEQAITNAQNDIASLKSQVAALDLTLEQAAKDIEKRDHRGGITNGLAVTGAGMSLGLAAAAYLTVQKGGTRAGVSGLIIGFVSTAASVGALLMGGTSQIRKALANPDTKELETQLTEAQKNVDAMLAQNTDKATANTLNQLNLTLKNVQSSLQAYKSDQNDSSMARLASQASQLLGMAMVTYAVVTKKSGETLFQIGLVTMNVGNLGAIVTGFMGEDADAVLKEIQQTRAALKVSTAGL